MTAAASVHVRTALGDKAFNEASSRGAAGKKLPHQTQGQVHGIIALPERVTHAVRADMFPNDIAA